MRGTYGADQDPLDCEDPRNADDPASPFCGNGVREAARYGGLPATEGSMLSLLIVLAIFFGLCCAAEVCGALLRGGF